MKREKVEPTTPEFYRNNRLVTAERVAEIDKELSRILKDKGTDDITPGRPQRPAPSRGGS